MERDHLGGNRFNSPIYMLLLTTECNWDSCMGESSDLGCSCVLESKMKGKKKEERTLAGSMLKHRSVASLKDL
jgi:hypothetical protein